MNNIFDIIKNYVLISAVAGWFVAQFSKVLTGMFREDKFNLIQLLVSTGGMPSSHSAMVSALCAASGIQYGVASFQFAVTFVLAMIVMRDAAGVRKDVGDQAKVLNELWEKVQSWPLDDETLSELVGHTPFQVLIGSIVGIAVAILIHLLYLI